MKFSVGQRVRIKAPLRLHETCGVVTQISFTDNSGYNIRVLRDGLNKFPLWFKEDELELENQEPMKLAYEHLIPQILANEPMQVKIHHGGWLDVDKRSALQWVASSRTDFELRVAPQPPVAKYFGLYQIGKDMFSSAGAWNEPEYVRSEDEENAPAPLVGKLEVLFDRETGKPISVKLL